MTLESMILLAIVLSILVICWFGFYKKKRVVEENLEVVVEENLEKEAERLACVFFEEAHKNDCLSYTSLGRAGDGFLSYRFEGVYKNIPISIIKRGVGITDKYLLTVEVGEHRYYYGEKEASKMWKIFESLYSKIREEQKLRKNEQNRRQITLIKTAMGDNA